MKIGIADTTFSRVDLGRVVADTLRANAPRATLVRYTVPGVKDLPVACKKLIAEDQCAIVVACGWVGKMPIDKVCGHEASTGIQAAQLATNTHVLEAFVHEDEARNPAALVKLARERARKHALNALALLHGKAALAPYAGKGRRQGHADAGPLE